MSTFGEKLRQEREARNITLREIATETKIGIRYLKALESGDFATLPGGVFNKGYVRAVAAHIGADADDLVQAYVEEERTRDPAGGREEPDVLRAMAESTLSGTAKPSAFRPSVILVSLAVGVLAVGAWAYLRWLEPGEAATTATAVEARAQEPEPSEPVIVAQPPAVEQTRAGSAVEPESTAPEPAEPEGVVTPPPVELERTLPPPPPVEITQTEPPSAAEAEPAADAPTESGPSPLSVPESGVGTAVVNRRLRGQSDQFTEGTQIWFWTRVVGGEAGDRVRHVWLRDGRAISSVELSLGGPHWRTQSRKTLLPGSIGSWAVEARDTDNRVLAREEFVCVQ